MILVVYLKKTPKDQFQLYSVAETMETAKKYSKAAIRQAKKIGYDEPDTVIQSFTSAFDVPEVINNPVPERFLFN